MSRLWLFYIALHFCVWALIHFQTFALLCMLYRPMLMTVLECLMVSSYLNAKRYVLILIFALAVFLSWKVCAVWIFQCVIQLTPKTTQKSFRLWNGWSGISATSYIAHWHVTGIGAFFHCITIRYVAMHWYEFLDQW